MRLLLMHDTPLSLSITEHQKRSHGRPQPRQPPRRFEVYSAQGPSTNAGPVAVFCHGFWSLLVNPIDCPYLAHPQGNRCVTSRHERENMSGFSASRALLPMASFHGMRGAMLCIRRPPLLTVGWAMLSHRTAWRNVAAGFPTRDSLWMLSDRSVSLYLG